MNAFEDPDAGFINPFIDPTSNELRITCSPVTSYLQGTKLLVGTPVRIGTFSGKQHECLGLLLLHQKSFVF